MRDKITHFFMNDKVVVLLSILLIFFAIIPLFHSGFFSMHDDEQVGRLYEFDQAVKQGYIPPRLSQDLGFGYGYPFFNFYPSFVYYVAEIFILLGGSYIVSLKIMLLVGFILSFFFMYLFSKELFGRIGGIISAIAYTYVPYHAVDIYVRGAFPEFWSFVFIPALFWSYQKLFTTLRNKYLVYSAIFGACFILTHNLMAMMSGFFLLPYIAFLILRSKKKKTFTLKVIVSGVSALLLSAYFWIPSFFEKKYTMVDLLTSELADYKLHFVYLQQFWNSPWGYGGSTSGINDGLSFQLGKIHILAVLLVLIITIVRIILKKRFNKLYLLIFFLFLLSLFMQTFYSKFIWDFLPPFWYIQFPWRFLVFSGFFSSIIVGIILSFVPDRKQRVILGICLVAIIVLFNKKYFMPQTYYTEVKDEQYTNKEFLRWDTSRLSFEYVPKGIATKKSPIGNTIVDINKNEIAQKSYEIVSGDMSVTEIKDFYQEKEFKVKVEKQGLFRINTYSFPGWEVSANGIKLKYTDTNKLKLITVLLGQGTYDLTVKFEDTPIRKMANLLSAVSIAGLVMFFVNRVINVRKLNFFQ